MKVRNDIEDIKQVNISLIDIMRGQIAKGYFENEIMRFHSGDRRRAYRLVMASYFTSAFLNDEREFNWAQYRAFQMYTSAISNDYQLIDEEILDDILNRSVVYLCNTCKFRFLKSREKDKFIIEDSILNKYIEFLKVYLKNEKTLFLYNEVKEFWDVNELFNRTGNTSVLPHHWIELALFKYSLPINTVPEFFAYQDVINLWNETLRKYNELVILNDNFKQGTDEYRTINYTYSTLLRSTLTAGVHYFETYLYYMYYNLKHKMKFPSNSVIKRNDIRKINDKEIIRKLLYKEFSNLESLTEDNWAIYQEALEYRDAFVHISAFEENGVSRMQYLLSFDLAKLKLFLSNIFSFIEIIEQEVGEEKILFWKSLFENPDFLNEKIITNIKNL